MNQIYKDENKDPVAVVNGARTPFVKAWSFYNEMTASQLGAITIRETIARSDLDPKMIDECYFGTVSSPPEGTNVAREALFDSGMPATIACTTINRYCASSIEAAAGIAAKIQAGQIEIGLAGGVESTSSVLANFSKQATDFFREVPRKMAKGGLASHVFSKFTLKHFSPHAPGIKEPTTGLSMGQSADLMAREFGVSRAEQDAYALNTHKKAKAGWDQGFFKSHVVAVTDPKTGKILAQDTEIKADSTLEQLAKLSPSFYKDGTITAGNASPLTDGAACVLLMRESRAKALGLPILGVIRGYAAKAVDIQKEPLLIGPAYAMPEALKKAGVSWNDLDLIEIHEAFAAQVLATINAIGSKDWCQKKLGLSSAIGEVDESKLNTYGGSIPLGHPFGATGARILMQTLHTLRDRKKSLGLISICAAGGLGSVMVVEAR